MHAWARGPSYSFTQFALPPSIWTPSRLQTRGPSEPPTAAQGRGQANAFQHRPNTSLLTKVCEQRVLTVGYKPPQFIRCEALSGEQESNTLCYSVTAWHWARAG